MMRPSTMSRRTAGALLGAGLLAVSVGCGSVYASVERGVRNGVPYEVGGWSDETARALKARADHYPVLLVFAQRDTGEYLADVGVTVLDAKGRPVAHFDDTGPLLLLGLEPGEYLIEAQRAGRTFARRLQVDADRHVQTVFRLPAAADDRSE